MPLNTRDLWLVLRAQDQTNRALGTFARNVRNAGNTVALAQAQAARAASLGVIQQARLATGFQRAAIATQMAQRAQIMHGIATRTNAIQTERATISQLAAQRAQILNHAATLRATGGLVANTSGLEAQARAITQNINMRRMSIATLQSEIAGLRGNVNGINQSINARRNLIAQYQNQIAAQQANIRNIDDEIGRQRALTQSQQEHERHLARMSQNFQKVGQMATAMGFAMTAAGAVMAFGLKKAIDTAVEYERQVRHTATQIDGFNGNLEQLGDIGRRVAKNIAVPFESIQPALFDIFSSMEVNMQDAEKLLVSFSKAAVAGQVDIQDVSRATIGLLNAFQRPASDVNKLLDIQFQLVQEGVGSYEEWNQRIGLVTPSAVRAGQSIEVMMAALAASTRMGLSAARSGTAVARAFDALSNPKTVSNLKSLGVNVLDATGKFRPFNEVLRDFRAVLMRMPEKDRLKTLLDVFKGAGGTIEARRFLQNMLLGKGNLELFDDILKETANSAGSMEKAYDLMSNSAAANSQMLANQWQLMKESVGKALIPTFALIVGWLAKMVGKFNELSPHTKRMVAFGLALASAFALVMGPLLLLIGLFATIIASFVVAGSAIAAVVGGLLAFVAIAAGAAATFVVLYKKSEGFRAILSAMGEQFNVLKSIVGEFISKVQSAFKSSLEKPLQRLAETIETKVLPALLEFYKMYTSAILPKVREAARIIADLLGSAFKYVAMLINSFVIPAINKLTELWDKHKEKIMPLLNFFGQLVKWFLIIAAVITGVLAAALVGVFIAAILAAIGVIVAFVLNLYLIWQALVEVWDQIKTFGVMVGDFFVAVWDGIVQDCKYYWAQIVLAAQLFWGFLVDLWHGVLNTITTTASTYWNGLKSYLSTLWLGLTSLFSTAVTAIVVAAAQAWNNIKSTASFVWNNLPTIIATALRNAWTTVTGWHQQIVQFFANAGSWLYNAGAEIVNGLIRGITSKIGALGDKAAQLAGVIAKVLPGSPVKAGPLRVLNNGYAGGQIVKMLADGMTAQMDLLQTTSNTMGNNVLTGFGASLAQTSPNYGGTSVVQNITVNTQEIDPRKNSAELGFELVKVL